MAALGGDGLRLLSVSRPERQPESAALGGPGPGLCCWVSVFSCLSLACSYVGSLYVWKSELPRDHPAVIKRRFTSVLVVSSLSPLCVLLWRELTGIQPGTSLLTLMGFRLEGIFPAALLPLLLTMILFLGPLMQLSMDCPCDLADGLKVVLAPRSWARCLTDMRWLRNQVIAPLTEELVFRACMLPMLAPCTGLGPAVFTCPLFFGVAHFHHIFEQLRFRQNSVGSIILSAVPGQEGPAGVVTRPPRLQRSSSPTQLSSVPTLLSSSSVQGMRVIGPGRRWGCSRRCSVSPPRTPDRAGPLPLLLQLHGLPRRVRRARASTAAAPTGRLCPGCRTLPASAPAPHRPQALRQPSTVCAPGAGGGLRGAPVLLTPAPVHTRVNSHGLPAPPHRGGLQGRSWLGSPRSQEFCRGLKPELVESQGPRERSGYPKGAAPLERDEEQLGVRGQEDPRSRAPPSSLWTAASLSSSALKSCWGCNLQNASPQLPRVFSLSFCIRNFVLGY
ncbi:CAAX prenyl protease 2 isoform X3 [Rhinolophus ferrumequinum]|uniref:CAAX prenyl protease 2 isoform X3 n=1 Tax=Rhinolophus ferrumequinum TaxID=59479 RepID=UPI00140FC1BE|nr:CAAX prenyl protease 2 isoform X3 [Rhinolophus ferrumequinum]